MYDTLSRSYIVQDSEVPPDDPQYVTMIEIGFASPFGEQFFQEFTMDSWFRVKGVLKDMKKRRGRKGLKTYLHFVGFSGTIDKLSVVFPLLSKSDRPYEMGLEKLEYLVDIVPLQLKSLPEATCEVWYSYDEATFKWSPATAMVGDINYMYKNNEWVQPSATPDASTFKSPSV